MLKKTSKPSAEAHYSVQILDRIPLGHGYFNVTLSRPQNFYYRPGQRIRFITHLAERDYSLISIPDENMLSIYVRLVDKGKFTPLFLHSAIGEEFTISGPHGHFMFHPSQRESVFIATGTGVAPFVAFARSGINGFTLLHGVRDEQLLHHKALFTATALKYVACITGVASKGFENKSPLFFSGTVDSYLIRNFFQAAYDFYVCGASEMIRDITRLIDEHYPDSRLFYEIFY